MLHARVRRCVDACLADPGRRQPAHAQLLRISAQTRATSAARSSGLPPLSITQRATARRSVVGHLRGDAGPGVLRGHVALGDEAIDADVERRLDHDDVLVAAGRAVAPAPEDGALHQHRLVEEHHRIRRCGGHLGGQDLVDGRVGDGVEVAPARRDGRRPARPGRPGRACRRARCPGRSVRPARSWARPPTSATSRPMASTSTTTAPRAGEAAPLRWTCPSRCHRSARRRDAAVMTPRRWSARRTVG